MKVCAHIQLGPFNREHKRFNTIRHAITYFTNEVAGIDFGTGTSEQSMWLNEQCPDCWSEANFHEFPIVIVQVGPRGGIVRTAA